jgi:hypothetical protein
MARGRMISKSLSTSERFASLHHEAGKLAEFCQSLYPLLVAHADDWGCLQGDTFTVKHLTHPTSPRKLVEFDKALKALHNVKLITWYEVEGKWFVFIRGWYAHQQLKGHDKDGRKRTFPEPPENPSNFESFAQSCPKLPKSALREEKRTELNLTYTVADATAEAVDPDLSTDHVTNSDVGAFLKRFCELYSHYRHGAKYLVSRQKDVPNARRLLLTYERPRLENLTKVLLTTDDEWVAATDRGIGILTVKAAWLDGLLAEYEAKHGRFGAA